MTGRGVSAPGHAPWMDRDLALVKETMMEALSGVPGVFGDQIRDQASHSGGLFRPRLFLATHRSFRTEPLTGTARKTAAALELLHLATLLHDDILDNAPLRRGRITMQALHGPRKAVLAGDVLLASSMALVADILPAAEAGPLARGIFALCQGEVLQLVRQDPFHPSLRLYRRQAGAKTALLIALSCRAGAWAAGADPESVLIMQRFGFQAGMGFQIVDDLKDFAPDGMVSGKTPFRDIRSGILNAPVLFALKGERPGNEESRELLAKKLSRKMGRSRGSLKDVNRLVASLGGFRSALDEVGIHRRRCLDILRGLPRSEGRSELERMIGALGEGVVPPA